MRRAVAVACLLALVACTRSGNPKMIDGVQEFTGLAHTHVPGVVTYPQTPPVGGPHSQVWLKCGVYDEAVPNENAVHSMEHGAVWLTYRPDLSTAEVDTLHRLQALKPAFVLISPYPGVENVVASAWGLQLRVDSVKDKRLAEFVKRYAGGTQGGEKGTRCDNGFTPAQIAQYNAASASANPTPSAS